MNEWVNLFNLPKQLWSPPFPSCYLAEKKAKHKETKILEIKCNTVYGDCLRPFSWCCFDVYVVLAEVFKSVLATLRHSESLAHSAYCVYRKWSINCFKYFNKMLKKSIFWFTLHLICGAFKSVEVYLWMWSHCSVFKEHPKKDVSSF